MGAVLDNEPISASDAEVPEIRKLDEALTKTAAEGFDCILLGKESVHLPASVSRLLMRAIRELANGNAVVVIPVNAELTTQEAADLLNVSRPFLVKLLESGEIPFHLVGAHRRVLLHDVISYLNQRSLRRRTVLAEMAREAQEMGTYE